MKALIVNVTEVIERQYEVDAPLGNDLTDEQILQHCEEHGVCIENARVHLEVQIAQDDDLPSP